MQNCPGQFIQLTYCWSEGRSKSPDPSLLVAQIRQTGTDHSVYVNFRVILCEALNACNVDDINDTVLSCISSMKGAIEIEQLYYSTLFTLQHFLGSASFYRWFI